MSEEKQAESAVPGENDIQINAILLPLESACMPKDQFVEMIGLAQQAKYYETEVARLMDIFKWVLGETYDFPERPADAGAYWWRAELRDRLRGPDTPVIDPTAGQLPN